MPPILPIRPIRLILAGLIAGSFYALLLAIPFGLAWSILIADA